APRPPVRARARARRVARAAVGELGAMVVPHHRVRDLLVEQCRRAPLVDVPDQSAVDAVADQLAQARREPLRDLARDAELLILLLADESGAVVHRDPDAALARVIRATA